MAPGEGTRVDVRRGRGKGTPGPKAQARPRVRRVQGVDLHTYQVVTNSIADYISVVGEDEVYRLVNDAWCRHTGLAHEQVVGRNVSEVFPESISEQRRRAFAECLRTQRVSVLRDEFRRPGAAPEHLETTYSPFAEAVQGVRCVVLVTRDITAEEQAREAARASETQTRALLDAFPGYIAAFDEDLRYTYINQRAAGLLGLSVSDVIGRPVLDVLGRERYDLIQRDIAQLKQGHPVMVERHYPERLGHARLDLEVRVVSGPTLPDGRHSYYVFGVDITERKLAQEALTTAKDDAERANRAKSRFMSMM